MTETAQNADFRRKPLIFADSPLLLEIPALGGRRKPQKTADFRRKPKIFAENRRKPQIGLRHLRCVTFSSALNKRKELVQDRQNAKNNTTKTNVYLLNISFCAWGPGVWEKTSFCEWNFCSFRICCPNMLQSKVKDRQSFFATPVLACCRKRETRK